MRILYIYPHPDDESFGTAHVMHKQIREGHEVLLLTLTRGGATKQRFKYNLSVEEMGEIRHKEMLCVEKVLGLTGMKVLNLPDSGLKEMDPGEIEEVVKNIIIRLNPDVIVTYAVHGISGFHDHLVTHAVVKRVFSEIRNNESGPFRLAMLTLREEDAKKFSTLFNLSGSKEEEIDCVLTVDDEDIKKAHQALDCYETFRETIEKSKIKDHILKECYFEFYQEEFTPPVNDLFEGIKKNFNR
jgi:N-acetylglucosamine malate deacetylase 2